jgi:hypothetical protein
MSDSDNWRCDVPRHDLDVLSLMAGVFFAGVALLGLLDQGSGDAAGWVWPTLLILVGAVGLLATRSRHAQGGPAANGHRDEDVPAG